MIKHIKCNIFESGADVILHQVNCKGVMNSGVARQVRMRYPNVYDAYKRLCSNSENPNNLLGLVQIIATQESDSPKYIANLFAQADYGYKKKRYTKYLSLKKCLQSVHDAKRIQHASIAIPYRMGCCRGGGNWSIVSEMIDQIFKDRDVLICEYDLG